MAENSKIEWTHHTFNPWWGCIKVSPACKHCYAESWAKRWGSDLWGAKSDRRFFTDKHWKDPVKWNLAAAESGTRERVFCASMADVFEVRSDLDEQRERLWQLIEDTPNLDWLLLTKRIEAVADIAPWGNDWPSNVWLGTTVENQKYAKLRLPHLVNSPARTKFISCEPLLGPLAISEYLEQIDWAIAGGESGPRARPMDPAWVRSLRDQCIDSSTAFHFKQWGNWLPVSGEEEFIKSRKTVKVSRQVKMANVGKKMAGRILDGVEWNELPIAS